MGTTSQKLTYLNETKTQIRKGLNRLGADLTSEDTFRSYAAELDEIYDSLPKVENETASESVTLTPTRKAQMQLDLLGNTQQDSTTGKNLAQRIGGYLTADGTFKTSNDDSFYFPVTQGETYTYNATGNRTLGAIYDNIPSNNATPISGTYSNNMVKNSPFIASATGIMVIYANTPSSQDTINSFIAVKGNVIGDYEPFTNGASPNPDYPQQIHTCSGDNTIYVGGSNIFDGEGQEGGWEQTVGSTLAKVYSATQMRCKNIMDVQPNTNYVFMINGKPITENARYIFADENNIILSSITTTDGKITTPNNCKHLVFHSSALKTNYGTTLPNAFISNYQSHLISLGDIELNKIGTYQDEIYRYGGVQIIPNGYQQVEYIESSGTQYINTGISPTLNTGIKIKASLVNENSTDKVLFGSRVSGNRYWLDFDGSQTPPYFMYGFGSYYRAGNYSLNTDYEISFNYNGEKKLIINDNTYTMSGNPDYTNSIPIYLFRGNYSASYSGNFKIYYCQIYEGTTLLRDYIPCIRKSDNAVGMYDLVSKSFFANAGTGTFIYGKKIGKWYLHKEIGKVVLDGTQNISVSNWRASETSVGWLYPHSIVNSIVPSSNLQTGIVIANKLPEQTYKNMYDKTADNGISLVNNEAYSFAIRTTDTTLTSNSAINTYLSSNPIEVYYVLATPTNTEITDTTLLEQLENIYSMTGTTNITQENNDLAMGIVAKALRGE